MARPVFGKASLLAGLALVAGLTLAPVVGASPPPAAKTDSAQKTEHGSAAPSRDPPRDAARQHHPRGDLSGSFSLNTPARPGFWIATGFTGLVAAAWLITLVLFRPGRPQ